MRFNKRLLCARAMYLVFDFEGFRSRIRSRESNFTFRLETFQLIDLYFIRKIYRRHLILDYNRDLAINISQSASIYLFDIDFESILASSAKEYSLRSPFRFIKGLNSLRGCNLNFII